MRSDRTGNHIYKTRDCSISSSTEVVHVATDAGNGFLKGMGNRQGDESLACELVGSELAALVGLSVPPLPSSICRIWRSTPERSVLEWGLPISKTKEWSLPPMQKAVAWAGFVDEATFLC
jgi:hypothetical protein